MTEILNKFDKLLHDKIHANMLKQKPENILDNPRLLILKELKNFIDIRGIIADVGCGSGYFGIGTAKMFSDITRVDCIEASKAAIENVIPRNISHFNLTERVKAINGSFDTLPKNEYDIIFAMGALHHSTNLDLTLKSIFHSLKPDGILVAQEPAMPDTTTHHEYQIKYDIIEEIFGLKIKNKDRNDRFFRECEYKNSLILNGFDILKWQDFRTPLYSKNSKIEFLINCLKSSKIYDKIRKFKNKYFNAMLNNQNLSKNNWQEKMQISTINLKPKLFVAKKTNCKEIFHEK